MNQYLKENFQFLVICIIWLIAGILVPQSSLALIPAALLLFRYKAHYSEIVVTIFLVNYFSDNRNHEFAFASQVKGYVVMLAGLLYYINKKQFPERSKIIAPFIPFFIVAFLLFSRNPDPALSFQKTLSYFILLAAIPNYFIRQIHVERENFLKKIIWLGFILFAIGLLFIFIMPEEWTYAVDNRFNGLLGNPNGVGTMGMLLFLLIQVSLYHYPDMLSRNEKIMILGLILFSIVLSGSRNSIFSIFIYLLFSYFFRVSPWIGFAIVMVAAVLFQIVNENLPAIFNAIGLGKYLRVEHMNNGSGRLVAWTYAWEQIRSSYFLFGRGFAFEEYLFLARQDWFIAHGHLGMVHNSFLALWLNTGIVGLLCFIYGLLSNFIKAAKINPLTYPCLFAIIFSNMFESWLQASLNPFTIIALLILTLLQYAKPQANAESPVPVL